MVELATEAGVVALLNFERRFDPMRERLRELILDGVIGEPNHFQYSRFIATPQPRAYGWLSSKELGGGWLGGQGSHLIDACRWLFGEIEEAGAEMRTLVAERTDRNGKRQKCDAEDAFVATLRTATGVTAVIDCALESSVSTPERMAVFGSTGVLEIGEAGMVRRMADGEVESYEVNRPELTPHVGQWEGPDRRAVHGPAALAMERWAPIVRDAVGSGTVKPGSPTFADGFAAAIVMDQMRR
jgi:predicted dehydrogenase